jgi:hypothetical protein
MGGGGGGDHYITVQRLCSACEFSVQHTLSAIGSVSAKHAGTNQA